MKHLVLTGLSLFLLLSFSSLRSCAGEGSDSSAASEGGALKVHVDCNLCDMDYIKTEITFVSYVRDPREADVHILVTTASTGARGLEYTVLFVGREEFKEMEDTLRFFCRFSDSDETERREMVRVLKLGLMRYVARTALAEQIFISYEGKSEPIC